MLHVGYYIYLDYILQARKMTWILKYSTKTSLNTPLCGAPIMVNKSIFVLQTATILAFYCICISSPCIDTLLKSRKTTFLKLFIDSALEESFVWAGDVLYNLENNNHITAFRLKRLNYANTILLRDDASRKFIF